MLGSMKVQGEVLHVSNENTHSCQNCSCSPSIMLAKYVWSYHQTENISSSLQREDIWNSKLMHEMQ